MIFFRQHNFPKKMHKLPIHPRWEFLLYCTVTFNPLSWVFLWGFCLKNSEQLTIWLLLFPTILQDSISYTIQIEKVEKYVLYQGLLAKLAAWKSTKCCLFGTPLNFALDLLSINMYPCLFWYPITFFEAKVVVGIFRSTSYNI